MRYYFLILNNVFKKKIFKWLCILTVFILIYYGIIFNTVNTIFFNPNDIYNLLNLILLAILL